VAMVNYRAIKLNIIGSQMAGHMCDINIVVVL